MKYASLPFLFAIGLMLWLSTYNPILAQTTPPSGSATCGTVNLTKEQATSLVKEANQALQRKRATNPSAFTSITYVPIRPHIIRRSDGTGGFSLASLNQVMAATNKYYLSNGFGIQFYFAGATPDYIDNDSFYNGYIPDETGIATNALNQYYANQFAEGLAGVGGLAFYPFDLPGNTCSYILTGLGEYDEDLGNRLIPHELGHTFGLIHTFGQNPGDGTLGSGATYELVTRGAGANCTTEGDLICDTPADPYNMPGANLYYPDSCPHYDPASTARDANGDPYTPSITNIMSYYFPCTHDFTPGQYDRIQAGLALRQSHTSYSLDAPATNVIPPSNLTATFTLTSVALTWQDNANNEMGYFIERSTSPTTGYVPIGGVAPDVTSFTDNQITYGSRYYYRIRPSNTTTGNLSPLLTISICPAPSSTSSQPVRTSASISWVGIFGQTYTIQWRVAGAANWTTITNPVTTTLFSSTFYSLTGLAPNTAYEWQVQASCSPTLSSDFTSIQSFTTLTCQSPYASANDVGGGSVRFFWYNQYEEPGRTAELRYRIMGSPTWSIVSSISSVSFNTNYILMGLANNSTYEWQVKHICSTTESSDYSPLATFTTVCRTPTALSTIPTATQATLGWSISSTPDPGTTYNVRYRPVGTTQWNNISAMVGGGGSTKTYSLTGLTINSQYEWQVQTACSATAQSDYSVTKQFTTSCNPLSTFTNVLLIASTSARLFWGSPNDPGTPHDLRYRPVGTQDWTTITVPNTSASGGLYDLTGLTNNTTYEWQIRLICPPNQPSAFLAGPNFTTQCRIPSSPYVNPTMATSATLQWQQTGIDVTYDVQYRRIGTPNWTTLSNLTSLSVTVTGLTSSAAYEWQVRTVCHDGFTTDFSSVSNFTTSSCSTPGYLQADNITSTAALLNWYFFNADTHFDIRYRVVGSADWITLNNLPGSTGTSSFSLTGLSSATTYEWQVRSLCSPTESSGFSNSATFQTLTPCPDMYTVKDGLWTDPTVWSCNRLPTTGDVVQIKHQVIVPASYVAILQRMGFDAGKTVSYGTSAQLKLGF